MDFDARRLLRRAGGLAFMACALAAPRAQRNTCAQGLSPEAALERMKPAPGFEVRLFAAEPDIRQPVCITFDERGRLWAIQYLQYPAPAGLKAVEVDRYLRTKWDRLPEPPPRGPKGLDRITICEDADGDGKADRFKDFTGGLNLATGLEFGYGGVFVIQAPYLLFYADKNRDDAPDGDPEVLLEGFGMEDSHAYANSLTWGPDGWLYGAHGSTVTAHIRGVTFQQGIWRYHPKTRAFELFSEGGGNTWGLDFDRHGNAIAGTNYGGVAMLHQFQGAYYVKNFGKHGELQNPYAFGYFEHIPYEGFVGGHVTCGGVIYRENLFPGEFRDQYLAANLLSNMVNWHLMEAKGASFTNRHGGTLLNGADPWFRPVDSCVGPEGALYVADWHDKRANHVDPKDDWDRTNGRIYKIQPAGSPPVLPRDLSALPEGELLAFMDDRSGYHARMARRILAERGAKGAAPALKKKFLEAPDEQSALETLWTLHALDSIGRETERAALAHPSPYVRAWIVRIWGDGGEIPNLFLPRVAQLAAADPSLAFRAQLACTAKRLAAPQALPMVNALARRDENAGDAHLPLLVWWALESKAATDRAEALALFEDPAFWRQPLVKDHLIARLARRYAAAGGEEDFASCARLLALAPDPDGKARVIDGMEKGLEGKRFEQTPAALAQPMKDLLGAGEPSVALLRLSTRLAAPGALDQALNFARDSSRPEADRARLIEVTGQYGGPAEMNALLQLTGAAEPNAVRAAALAALARSDSPDVPARVLADYKEMPGDLRSRARSLLAGRPAWAMALLQSVEGSQIDAKEVSPADLRRIMLHGQPELAALVEKNWGKVKQEDEGAKRARMNGINAILGLRPGDAIRGRTIYAESCGKCHELFGEGKKIGPDLTGADRKNREFWLSNIVDPNLSIRPEYINHIVETKDGQILTGLLAEQTPDTVTVLDAEDRRTQVARGDIKEVRPSDVSLMPEELLDPVGPEDIQDLFAYLQSDGPAGN